MGAIHAGTQPFLSTPAQHSDTVPPLLQAVACCGLLSVQTLTPAIPTATPPPAATLLPPRPQPPPYAEPCRLHVLLSTSELVDSHHAPVSSNALACLNWQCVVGSQPGLHARSSRDEAVAVVVGPSVSKTPSVARVLVPSLGSARFRFGACGRAGASPSAARVLVPSLGSARLRLGA